MFYLGTFVIRSLILFLKAGHFSRSEHVVS